MADARGVQLVEEMLAVQLQCLMDGGGLSNFPRSSIGALVLLQALDRSDLEQPLEWLYDRSQERLRTFVSNNFFSDGTPPEATGGYNDTHSMGLFELEENLQRLRTLHPSTIQQNATHLSCPNAVPHASRVRRTRSSCSDVPSWGLATGLRPACRVR